MTTILCQGKLRPRKGAAERELLSPNSLLCLLSNSSKGRASNCPRGRSRRGMDLQGLLAPIGLGTHEARVEGWWPPGKAQANTASAEKLLTPVLGQGPQRLGRAGELLSPQRAVSRTRPCPPTALHSCPHTPGVSLCDRHCRFPSWSFTNGEFLERGACLS